MRSSVLLSAALLAFSAAKPLRSRSVVKETHHVPHEFSRVGDAPGHHLIRLQVGLKQNNFEELERHLYESEHSAFKLFKASSLLTWVSLGP